MRINKEAIPTMIICAIAIVIAIPISMYITSLLEGKKYYTATFLDLEGVYQTQENIEKNGRIIEPMAPYKEGYEFLGWYSDDLAYDFNTPVTQDLYIKAKWLNNSTRAIEEMDDTAESQIKSGSNTGTPRPTATPVPTSSTTPVPAPTPVPQPQPDPVPAQLPVDTPTSQPQTQPEPEPQVEPPSVPTTKKYTITVKTGSKVITNQYDEGSTLRIAAVVPNSSKSDWIGNTACGTASDIGKRIYKELTSWRFKGWSDGDTNISRIIQVNGDATYEALFEKVVQYVDYYECSQTVTENKGYPSSINFQYKNKAAASGSTTFKTSGYITPGHAAALTSCTSCKKGTMYVAGFSCSLNVMQNSIASCTSDSYNNVGWIGASSGVDWMVSYDKNTGIVNINNNEHKAGSKRTVTLDVYYRESEIADNNYHINDSSSSEAIHVSLGSLAHKSVNSGSTVDPIDLNIQLDKVLLSKEIHYDWKVVEALQFNK